MSQEVVWSATFDFSKYCIEQHNNACEGIEISRKNWFRATRATSWVRFLYILIPRFFDGSEMSMKLRLSKEGDNGTVQCG